MLVISWVYRLVNMSVLETIRERYTLISTVQRGGILLVKFNAKKSSLGLFIEVIVEDNNLLKEERKVS